MQWRVIFLCLFFTLINAVGGAALWPHPAAAEEKIILTYFEDYQPFSWKNEAGEMQGILIDILEEVLAKRLGLTVVHQGYPWTRAQEMVKFGAADGFCTVPTEARREYTVISGEPVIRNTVSVFTWKGNPLLDTMKGISDVVELKDYQHGQYEGSGWARKHLAGMRVMWVASLNQVLEMLAARRVDVLVESTFVTHFRIKSMGLADKLIEVPDTVVDENSFNLCIGKQSPHRGIIEDFDRAMGRAREGGVLEAILQNYR